MVGDGKSTADDPVQSEMLPLHEKVTSGSHNFHHRDAPSTPNSASSSDSNQHHGVEIPSSLSLPSASSTPPPPFNNPPPSSTDDPKRKTLELLFGAGGIYAAFLYYGSLQEDVFRYVSPHDSTKFTQAWFLQSLEALANVVVGSIALRLTGGGTKNLPMKPFLMSGASQVSSKAFTSLALANGLSFPVATLAKSGKMAPVMIGSLVLGGAKYNLRDYLQVLAIIFGTAILSMGKKKGSTSDCTPMGVVFVLLALVMDGVTGGVQKRLLADMHRVGVSPRPYDFMTWTNVYMMLVATVVSLLLGEFFDGVRYCQANPAIFRLIVKFSVCSAVGQSFIFYTVARFDPLVCSTVTTTRKIFSVILSILLKGHHVSLQGWAGLGLAIGGISSEVVHKARGAMRRKRTT